MRDYYYNHLSKEEKKKIKEKYKDDYAKSDFDNRLKRLLIYSFIGFIFSIFLVVYSFITNESMISNLLIAIPLFIVSVIFLIGRYYAKITVLNKIALNLKKN